MNKNDDYFLSKVLGLFFLAFDAFMLGVMLLVTRGRGETVFKVVFAALVLGVTGYIFLKVFLAEHAAAREIERSEKLDAVVEKYKSVNGKSGVYSLRLRADDGRSFERVMQGGAEAFRPGQRLRIRLIGKDGDFAVMEAAEVDGADEFSRPDDPLNDAVLVQERQEKAKDEGKH